MSKRKRQSMVLSDSDSELENISHKTSSKGKSVKPKPVKKKQRHQPETVFVESDGEGVGTASPPPQSPSSRRDSSASGKKQRQPPPAPGKSPRKAGQQQPVQKNTLDNYFSRVGGGAASAATPGHPAGHAASQAAKTSSAAAAAGAPAAATSKKVSPDDFFGAALATAATAAPPASKTKKPVAASPASATHAAAADAAPAKSSSDKGKAKTVHAATDSDDPDIIESSFVSPAPAKAKTVTAPPPPPPSETPSPLKRAATSGGGGAVAAAHTPEAKRASYLAYLHRDGPKHLGEVRLPKPKPNSLSGMTIVITGVLDYVEKDAVEHLLHACGAKLTKSVSGKTSMLVVGREPGASKLDKARQVGVRCPLEREFYAFLVEKLGPPPDDDQAMAEEMAEVEMLGTEPGSAAASGRTLAVAEEERKSGAGKGAEAERKSGNGKDAEERKSGSAKGAGTERKSGGANDAEELKSGAGKGTVTERKSGGANDAEELKSGSGKGAVTERKSGVGKEADAEWKSGSAKNATERKSGSGKCADAERNSGGGKEAVTERKSGGGKGSETEWKSEGGKGAETGRKSGGSKDADERKSEGAKDAEERKSGGGPAASSHGEKSGGEQLMWVDKYKPRSLKQVIGQSGPASCAAKLSAWLSNWHRHLASGVKRGTAQAFQRFNDDGSALKAALLSGPPGIGKTTTATLACRELGFECLELNASDTRNKRSLHEIVGEALGAFSVGAMLGGGGGDGRRRCVIMDEVDGMAGNEDRGGVAELIQLIRTSLVPIICICNDRNHLKMRSLGNYCFDLRFNRPRPEQIRAAALSIASREGLKLDSQALLEVIAAANNDVRQTIHNLQAWTSARADLGADQLRKDAGRSKKDLRFGPFDLVRKALSSDEMAGKTINDLADLFFQDYNMEPLFVQENYLAVEPDSLQRLPTGQRDRRRLELLSRAADSIALGDVCARSVRANSNWGLLPVQALLSSVLPGRLLSGRFAGQVAFPSWLGRNSTAGKTGRQLALLAGHLRLATGGLGSRDLGLDLAQHLADRLAQPLRRRGAEGVADVTGVLETYDLLREDMDALLELAAWPGQPDPMQGVDAKVKAALTRAYNKAVHLTPYSLVQAPAKRAAAAATASAEDFLDEEDEAGVLAGEDEDEAADADPTLDAMIKKPKISKSSGAKSEKATAAGGGSKAAAVNGKKKAAKPKAAAATGQAKKKPS